MQKIRSYTQGQCTEESENSGKHSPKLQSLLESYRRDSELKASQFPLRYFLILYTRAPMTLYLNHFEGLKLLLRWLSPISPSEKQSISLPIYLITYEMQEIAKHTGNSVSQIYQELTELWISDYNT